MSRILLLGGCGYIGSRLYDFLISQSYDVSVVDTCWFKITIPNKSLQVNDYDKLSEGFLKRFDVILLLAGHSSVGMCEDNLLPAFNNNVRNFVNLVNKIDERQKLIYASSSSVYGNVQTNTADETCSYFIPNNYYDLNKQEIDLYASLQKNKQLFGLRFGTVNGYSKNFRTDIMINAMCHSAFSQGQVLLFNKETNRPILGITDLCRAVVTIIQDGTLETSGLYNLASFNSTSGKIATVVANELGVPLIEKEAENTSDKLTSKKYDFSIDCHKFCDTFDFIFNDDIYSIIQDIKRNYDAANVSKRQDKRKYG